MVQRLSDGPLTWQEAVSNAVTDGTCEARVARTLHEDTFKTLLGIFRFCCHQKWRCLSFCSAGILTLSALKQLSQESVMKARRPIFFKNMGLDFK